MVSKGLSNESPKRNFRERRLPPYKCRYRLGLDSYWNRAETEQEPSKTAGGWDVRKWEVDRAQFLCRIHLFSKRLPNSTGWAVPFV